MSVSYDYLEKMFSRLAEAKSQLAHFDNSVRKRAPNPHQSRSEKKRQELEDFRTRNMLDGTVCVIKCSIRDYLKMHGDTE